MQGYTYSVFSSLAIVLHLIINSSFLRKRKSETEKRARYRHFLMGVLAYYVVDATWGVFAGLGWTRALYVDTILFFLTLCITGVVWSRFVITYLRLGKGATAVLSWFGYALLAFNILSLAANPFCQCVFYFDAQGTYLLGPLRNPAIYMLTAFEVAIAAIVFAKALRSQDSVRRRSMMIFMSSLGMATFILLQNLWPLTPFTSLGCLICNCVLHAFVVQDEQATIHMEALEKALARTRAAEKARSLFFSIVSHDIRTPLNAIIGYSELLQDSLRSEAERAEALKAIRASGTTLLQLVNDVLDIAKLDAGKVTLRPEPLDIPALTDEVLSTFRLTAKDKGIELRNRTAGVPTLMLDTLRFRQILFNLIGNAVKFTDHGHVAVAASYAGSCLTLSVEDTGCGIPKEMLTHVLDPFVQVQDPTHSANMAKGTGLGLSICRRLIEFMGGEITVESEQGKGTTMTVRIPDIASTTASVRPAAKHKAANAPKNLPKRVLVVDDSPVNRKVLSALLKTAGVPAVNHACDAEAALAELEAAYGSGNPYDLVLTDYWMPKMNGLELIVRLRATEHFKRLNVFVVTADTEFINDPRTELFTGVLLKPLTNDKLASALAKL